MSLSERLMRRTGAVKAVVARRLDPPTEKRGPLSGSHTRLHIALATIVIPTGGLWRQAATG
jgi:hypothetical protein